MHPRGALSQSYIPDAVNNVQRVRTPQNHLIFGRRGAGKTALLVEAKKQLESEGCITSWVNIQTYRAEPLARIFLWIGERVCEAIEGHFRARMPRSLGSLPDIRNRFQALLGDKSVTDEAARALIPFLHSVIERAAVATGASIFIFLDDLHYLPKESQPVLLDMVHSAIRDSEASLKIATIKHL